MTAALTATGANVDGQQTCDNTAEGGLNNLACVYIVTLTGGNTECVLTVTNGKMTVAGTGFAISDLAITGDASLCTTIPTLMLALDTTSVTTGLSAGGTQAFVGTADGDISLSTNPPVADGDCKDCPAGYFSTEGFLECTSCPASYYQGSTVQSDCIACAAGTFEHTGVTAQASSICKDCPAGYYSNSAAGVCTGCPTSYFQAATTQTSCEGCTGGQYDDSADLEQTSSACKTCPIAYYSYPRGQLSCEACPAGYFGVATTQSSCLACPGAKYVETSASQVCADATTCGNMYKVSKDHSRCEKCPKRHIAHFDGTTMGSKACYDCKSHHGECEKANCDYSGLYCNEFE